MPITSESSQAPLWNATFAFAADSISRAPAARRNDAALAPNLGGLSEVPSGGERPGCKLLLQMGGFKQLYQGLLPGHISKVRRASGAPKREDVAQRCTRFQAPGSSGVCIAQALPGRLLICQIAGVQLGWVYFVLGWKTQCATRSGSGTSPAGALPSDPGSPGCC